MDSRYALLYGSGNDGCGFLPRPDAARELWVIVWQSLIRILKLAGLSEKGSEGDCNRDTAQVRSLGAEDLRECNVDIVLSNTFHLMLRSAQL